MKTIKTLLFLITFMLTAGITNAATIDVGTGYTYTTISSGLAAASSGDIVHVHAGTYTISSPLVVPSGVTLYGDGYNSTTILARSPLDFATDASPAMIYLNAKSNIVIYGFKFNGGGESLSIMHEINNDYRNYCSAIKIRSCTGVTIHDCYFTLTYGDSIRSSGDNVNTYVYNSVLNTPGHDGFSMYYGTNWRMSNCIVNTFINAGIRIENVEGAEVDHCTFYSDTDSGSGGVECLRDIGSNVKIHHNVFRNMHNSVGDGIFFYSPSSGSVDISNNIMYDIPGDYIDNNGFPYTGSGNQLGASSSTDWTSLGYGYDVSKTDNGVTSGYTPPPEQGNVYSANGIVLALDSPSNGASRVTVNGNITFTWVNVNSTNYNIQVSKYNTFNVTVRDRTTTETAISLALDSGTTYYWRVRAYDDSNSQWGAWTSAYTLTTTTTAYGTSGIYGVIYDTSTARAVPGAVITLVNDSWSQTIVTDEDGYYSFSLQYNPNSTMYYITCSATKYQTTPYQLPINLKTEYTEYNIALTASPEYFAPHNVRFIITDPYMRERYVATVSAYAGNDNMVTATGTTGTDGSISFALSETVRYRLKTEYNGITYTDYITPIDTTYYIIISSDKTFKDENQFYDNVTINVTKNEINSTHAYINASYLDSASNTTSTIFVLGQTATNGTFIELQNSSITAGNIAMHNFTISNYLGQDYIVLVQVNHKEFGNVTKAFAVTFSSNNSPFASSKEIAYLGIFILFIVATQFGRMEHASGSILLCAIAWFMILIGLFNPLGTAIAGMITAGTLAATVYSVIVYINDQRVGVY